MVFATSRQINNLVSRRDRLFVFDLDHVTEAVKVEIYRILENCAIEFAENRRKNSVFHTLSPKITKKFKIGIENLPFFSTLHVQIGKIFKKKIFFKF